MSQSDTSTEYSSRFSAEVSATDSDDFYKITEGGSGIEDSASDLESDFVLLGNPLLYAQSLPSTYSSAARTDSDADHLSSAFDKLSIASTSLSVGRSSDPSLEEDNNVVATKRARRRRQRATRKAKRAAQREQASSGVTSAPVPNPSTASQSYEEAHARISKYIACPQVKDRSSELALLRALIIELGVRSPSAPELPTTLTAARKLLKAEVHINIKEYIATRDQGLVALRKIMHPSKTSLRREIKKTGKRASLKWVKKRGLQVLLVKAFE
ncbi:hypothetical protein ID866_3943 [Astraeus odoratus]|nr:hypothetical protein ID866_3943 [Astraeus odoratus]